jgi:hypothetical protein
MGVANIQLWETVPAESLLVTSFPYLQGDLWLELLLLFCRKEEARPMPLLVFAVCGR